MKIVRVMTLAAAVAAANASAGEATPVAEQNVIVCVSAAGSDFVLLRAKSIAGGMFTAIGVKIEWHDSRSCPPIAIQISFSDRTSANFVPGALAYARPFEGTHIVVFYDRIVRSRMTSLVPYVLAHVMVHEITHILQGVPRHSESGVMKAVWDLVDYNEMPFKPLPFTQTDVELIHKGLDRRELHVAAAGSIR